MRWPSEPETTILLVDDDRAKRYTIAKTLVRAGFEVQEAGTGGEALRLVASLPDLVILDVKLPDIDGFEVCRASSPTRRPRRSRCSTSPRRSSTSKTRSTAWTAAPTAT